LQKGKLKLSIAIVQTKVVSYNLCTQKLSQLWRNFAIFKSYSCSWITIVFYVSFNSNFWYLPDFGVLFIFFGPKWIIFGLMMNLETYLGVYSCILTTFRLNFALFLLYLQFTFFPGTDGRTDKGTYRSSPRSLKRKDFLCLIELNIQSNCQ